MAGGAVSVASAGGRADRISRNLDGKSEEGPLCSAETLKFGSCDGRTAVALAAVGGSATCEEGREGGRIVLGCSSKYISKNTTGVFESNRD